MNLEKAKEILAVIGTNKDRYSISEKRAARQLGIEALKYALADRRGLSDCEIELLPGETKE